MTAEAEARQRLATCQQRQRQATEARHGLSHDYHPINVETVQAVSADEVAGWLSGHFDRLEQIAREAGLSPQVHERLAKARRVLPEMRSTIAFFWATVAARLVAWRLSATVTTWLREELIPGMYTGTCGGESEHVSRTSAVAYAGGGDSGPRPLARQRVGHSERDRAGGLRIQGPPVRQPFSAEQFLRGGAERTVVVEASRTSSAHGAKTESLASAA